MANNLHSVLPKKLITIQDLKNENFYPNKKWLMIDSRAYTPEAFQYVLKLSDVEGCLVFVYNTHKIWANGQYFGGDVFQESLDYFSQFASRNGDGILTGIIQAQTPQDLVQFVGINHVNITAHRNEETGENLMVFDYDLQSAVNTNRVEIGGSKYNLVVENGQIKLNEYKPMTVSLSSLNPLEFDSVDDYATVTFNIFIGGTIPNPDLLRISLGATADDGSVIYTSLNPETNTVTAEIPKNVNVKFDIDFSDGETSGKVSVWQKWGYKIYIGLYDHNVFGIGTINNDVPNFQSIFDSLLSNTNLISDSFIWVPGTKINKTTKLSVNYNDYGLFICPSSLAIEFTDTSVNLMGGWQPVVNKPSNMYSRDVETEYIIWRTDHMGIGLVNWKIVGESK